ncbi:DUF167 domain-containing protein [Gemmatimonadota bacterium]
MIVSPSPGGSKLTVRAQPKASRSEIVGAHGEALKVRLAAPPVDGAANDELRRLLAKTLKISRSRVEVVHGQSSRTKVLLIHGLAPDEVRRRLRL